jgi:hypothetical protein
MPEKIYRITSGTCREQEEMKNTRIIPWAIMVITLLCFTGLVSAQDASSTVTQNTGEISEDIASYSGPIGPDSPLHGLKVAMEDLDETFTFNDTQRIEKRVDHARIRISEVRRELVLNRTETADRALDLYWQKLNLTEMSLTQFAPNTTGLLHAQEMIARHQVVLANLSSLYPNNSGLARAYNNSLVLEQKFEQKTEMRLTRLIEKDRKTVFKAIKLEIRKQNRTSDDSTGTVGTPVQDTNKIQDRIKDRKDAIPVNETSNSQNEYRNNTPPVTKNPQDDKGSQRDKNKNGRDS